MPQQNKKKKKTNGKPCELLLLGLPKDIFYYILDFIFPTYNYQTMHIMHHLNNYYSYQLAIFIENFRGIMFTNKKMKEWTISYIRAKYDFILPLYMNNKNFGLNMQLLALSKELNSVEKNNKNNKNNKLKIKFLYLFLDILKKSINDVEILKKIKLQGQLIVELYSKKLKLSTNTPRETFDKIIENNINFHFFDLDIIFDVDGDKYKKITREIEKIENIFKVYKANIFFFSYYIYPRHYSLLKAHTTIINISRSIDFICNFTNDLLFTTINLDKFYFETFNDKIPDSKIIDSIVNKRIEPNLLYIYPDPDPRIGMDWFKKIDVILENCIHSIDEWKISDRDYLSIILLYRKYISKNIDIPKKMAHNPKLKYKICTGCRKPLSLHPYFINYIKFQEVRIGNHDNYACRVFEHYFCYLLRFFE